MLTSRPRSRRVTVEFRTEPAFQIAFIADWTSPNTPEMAMNRTTRPMIVARVPFARPGGAFDHALQRHGGLMAHQPAELVDDRALGGVAAEHQAGDRHDDQQHRRDGEERVVGDRGAPAQRLVVDEARERVAQEMPGGGQGFHALSNSLAWRSMGSVPWRRCYWRRPRIDPAEAQHDIGGAPHGFLLEAHARLLVGIGHRHGP